MKLYARFFSFAKSHQAFEIKQVNIKSRSPKTLIKRTSAAMELRLPKTLILLAPISQMVKHTQTIRRQNPTNCLSVFDHFVKLAFKGLTSTFIQTETAIFIAAKHEKTTMVVV